MKFYTIDDPLLYTKIGEMTDVNWRQNCSFLKYKELKNEPVKEAKGHYIMYVVEDYVKFEELCHNLYIKITELPVNEEDYRTHFEIYYKGKKKLNEDLMHTFDDLEDFVQLISIPGEKLIITDSYSRYLTDSQVDKISNWISSNGMSEIEFVVPVVCSSAMTSIVSRFNSHGINVGFRNTHIHGRYWIVKDQGFFVDASVNTSGAFIAGFFTNSELIDVKNEYSL